MDADLRKLSIAVLAITIFSISSASGQSDANKARKATGNRGSIETGRLARPPSREAGPRVRGNLPFQQTVTIYYNPSEKRPVAAVNLMKHGSNLSRDGKAIPPKITAASTQKEVEIRAKTLEQLKPLIIRYRTFKSPKSIAVVEPPRQPLIEPKNKAGAVEKPKTPEAFVALKAAPTTLADASFFFPRKIERTDQVSIATVRPAAAAVTQVNRDNTAQPSETIIESSPVEVSAEQNTDSQLSEIPKPITATLSKTEALPSADAARVITDNAEARIPDSIQLSTPRDLAGINSSGAASAGSVSPGRESVSMEAVDHNNAAIELTLARQYAEAEALLQRAINSHPDVGKFHRNLSIVYHKMNLIDKALASARTAEQLSPADPSVVEQRCVMELEAGEAGSAVACYQKLASILPLDDLSRTYLGVAMFKSGKVDESIVLLEKAASSEPPLAAALNALGVAYFHKKRIREAAATFKRAVEAAPDMAETRYNLAIAQLSLRNRAGAISQYGILKEGSPELATRLYRILVSDKIVVIPKN